MFSYVNYVYNRCNIDIFYIGRRINIKYYEPFISSASST